MKIEQSYKNYLPQKIKLIISIIGFVIFSLIGVFEYYQLATSIPNDALIEKIEWNTVPYLGYRNMTVNFSGSSESITLPPWNFPFYYHVGDTVRVYFNPKTGYLIYDPIEFFIITPILILGSLLFIKSSLKKRNIKI